ncbi:helix-turn-helix domain-containing protein, partial [Pseudoclavibacter sp. Z016]|uniref:helix-turn-helix domain-containing protein n=1 Tax=Pseudoclavibacter sp. Z016 TaxID=2080581 RepID=UPI000D44B4DD
MNKQGLVITAALAGASQSATSRKYGVSQPWISRLIAHYRAEGEFAFEPRSRRPAPHPPRPTLQRSSRSCTSDTTFKM